jgi:outer membrane protein assembly factor BamB
MRYGQLGFSNVARPVFAHGFLYVCTGFMRSELLAVRPSPGPGRPGEVAWRYRRNVPKIPSPVVVGDEIYFAADSGGMVTCLDARTGGQIWRERIAGGKYNASPLFAGGHLYFHSEEGVTTVLAPGKEFKKVAENVLDGKLMASAAVAGDALILRTDQAVYRIENTGAPDAVNHRSRRAGCLHAQN